MANNTGLEYILGRGSITEFGQNGLLTIGDVLCFYSQYWGKNASNNVKELLTANALEALYRSKKIPTVCSVNVKRKIKREVGNLAKILKFKSKGKSAKQIKMENEFKSTLSNIFSIEKNSNEPTSSADISMEIDEQGEDSNLNDSECEIQVNNWIDQDNSQDYCPPSDDEDPSDIEFPGANKKKSIPDDILWKMCKTGVSFNMLSKILKLGFTALGESDNFHLSPSHFFKRYQKMTEIKEVEYNQKIGDSTSFGTICFDHHSMKQLSGKFIGKEDRLAILWHSNSEDKLISIDKIVNKSGRSQLEAILQACENFEIDNIQIVAVSCDNENANTGNETGTCVLLEQALMKDLLRSMCRHHIYEIVLKTVYKKLFPSTTPSNLFHPILSEMWSELKSNNFPFNGFDVDDEEILGLDVEQLEVYDNLKERAQVDLLNHADNQFVRDDYKEIKSACLKFLTGLRENLTKSNQVQFNALQNPSNARFMASSIQGLNCFLFRHQLNWDTPERENIRDELPRFCLFLALIYVRYWNRTNMLFNAGINDLKFMQDLEEFATIDQEISNLAIAALSRHLYYLSEEMIVLLLFSDKLSAAEKNQLAGRLLEIDENLPERNLRLNHTKYNEHVDSWSTKQIVDFIGNRSLHLFQLFNIPLNFLRVDANQWTNNVEYINAKNIIGSALVCVNDSTERVISTCKMKFKRQRCKNDLSFQRSMLENYMDV